MSDKESLIKLLENYGFGKKEAKIYLISLQQGRNSASFISKIAQENRVTTYSILKELTKKGFVNEIIKNNKITFEANSPKKILELYQNKCDKFKYFLPELLAITNVKTTKPKIFFYDGFGSLKEIYNDIIMFLKLSTNNGTIESKETMYTILGTNKIDFDFYDYLINDFCVKRRRYNLKGKTLMPKGKEGKYFEYQKNFNDVRYITEDYFDMGNEIIMYAKDKIAIVIYSENEMSGLIIKSKSLYKSFSNIFKLIRDGAK